MKQYWGDGRRWWWLEQERWSNRTCKKVIGQWEIMKWTNTWLGGIWPRLLFCVIWLQSSSWTTDRLQSNCSCYNQITIHRPIVNSATCYNRTPEYRWGRCDFLRFEPLCPDTKYKKFPHYVWTTSGISFLFQNFSRLDIRLQKSSKLSRLLNQASKNCLRLLENGLLAHLCSKD
jgi:hypothetical protein